MYSVQGRLCTRAVQLPGVGLFQVAAAVHQCSRICCLPMCWLSPACAVDRRKCSQGLQAWAAVLDREVPRCAAVQTGSPR